MVSPFFFLARSIFQNVAIFLGRKEGFGFWVTQKFSKIFLKLNMQSFEMTQLLLSKLSKQQEVLDWFQSSKTVVETCFQSALDTKIYPHSYGNNFCCSDLFFVLNSSGEWSFCYPELAAWYLGLFVLFLFCCRRYQFLSLVERRHRLIDFPAPTSLHS